MYQKQRVKLAELARAELVNLDSSTVQASGGDSRRIGAIIIWFMVSQAY
jgi:hypothetical protein